jgi:3-dehydroquinate synthase
MDEKEKGERKKLNFGHTAGHAIEKICRLPHGEAISIGMNIASGISVEKGMLSFEEGERLKKLLEKFKLPVNIEIDKTHIIDAMKKDKKKNMDYIDFILLEKIGKAVICNIRIDELNEISGMFHNL